MAGFRAGEGVMRRKPIDTIQDSEGPEGQQLTRTLGLLTPSAARGCRWCRRSGWWRRSG